MGFLVYRSEKKRLQNNKSETNMMENRPEAIGFTRGLSHEGKKYGGWTNYCRAIDRKVQSYDDIQGNDYAI